MQGTIAFKILRAIVYRAAWVFLYVVHLALSMVALSLFFCVVLVAFDGRGAALGNARHHVTIAQRCAMGLLYGSFGLLSAAGAIKLKRYHRRINPLYPEMQIGFHLARATARERLPQERAPRSADPLYDRDLDGGL